MIQRGAVWGYLFWLGLSRLLGHFFFLVVVVGLLLVLPPLSWLPVLFTSLHPNYFLWQFFTSFLIPLDDG